MLKKLRNKIEEKRNSKNLFWEFFVLGKDFVWKSYTSLKTSLSIYYFNLKRDFVLGKLIKNKKILVLGSGASALELREIPKGVVVFTCNAGLRFLKKRGFNGKAGLYLTRKKAITNEYPDVIDLLSKIKTKVFLFDKLGFIKGIGKLENSYKVLLKDRCKSNYYLEKLIKPKKIEDICQDKVLWTSSGMRLLQYALYFKAKEIYIAGMDFGGNYFWKKKNIHKHKIDLNFMEIVSKKYNNIFSASKKSPITRYIPYKELK